MQEWISRNTSLGFGPAVWIERPTISKFNSFSDFVEKPASFDTQSTSLLFNKSCSNFSFKVKDEVVFVLHGILTTRSEYFKAMILGSAVSNNELSAPLNVDSAIPIHGVDADVFKMIIEWIYTMEIRQFEASTTRLEDLANVFVAAGMFQITDLCSSILKYLESLVTEHTSDEIYRIAKRIGSESLEAAVYGATRSKYSGFDRFIEEEKIDTESTDGTTVIEDEKSTDGREYAVDEKAAMYRISRANLGADSWEYEPEVEPLQITI
jgi:hypothetical protein